MDNINMGDLEALLGSLKIHLGKLQNADQTSRF